VTQFAAALRAGPKRVLGSTGRTSACG